MASGPTRRGIEVLRGVLGAAVGLRGALGAAVAIGVAVGLSACRSSPPPSRGQGGPSLVRVATAQTRTMPIELTAVGSVVASASVALRPRVGGELVAIHVRDGQTVKKGQLLFEIDQRPLRASLAQAQATLHSVEAQAGDAALRARRYTRLADKHFLARDQADEQRAAADALAATVKADREAVRNARLQLGYARIRAPLSGVMGKRLVDRGNIVVAQTTVLATINQVEPIYVDFSIPERDLPLVKQAMERGPVPVTATPRAAGATSGFAEGGPRCASSAAGNEPARVSGKCGQSSAGRGTLTFIDNQIDRTTGTIALRATFTNHDRALWPGQFADAVATLATPTEVAVPSQAVQHSQQGTYVYVVGADQHVQLRRVALGQEVGGFVAVTRGVAAGERVVTDGFLRLTPGAAVEIAPPPPAPTTQPAPRTGPPSAAAGPGRESSS